MAVSHWKSYFAVLWSEKVISSVPGGAIETQSV